MMTESREVAPGDHRFRIYKGDGPYHVVEHWLTEAHRIDCGNVPFPAGDHWRKHRQDAQAVLESTGVTFHPGDWPVRFVGFTDDFDLHCGLCEARIGALELGEPARAKTLTTAVRDHWYLCPFLIDPEGAPA